MVNSPGGERESGLSSEEKWYLMRFDAIPFQKGKGYTMENTGQSHSAGEVSWMRLHVP